jgi:hypothetical protein
VRRQLVVGAVAVALAAGVAACGGGSGGEQAGWYTCSVTGSGVGVVTVSKPAPGSSCSSQALLRLQPQDGGTFTASVTGNRFAGRKAWPLACQADFPTIHWSVYGASSQAQGLCSFLSGEPEASYTQGPGLSQAAPASGGVGGGTAAAPAPAASPSPACTPWSYSPSLQAWATDLQQDALFTLDSADVSSVPTPPVDAAQFSSDIAALQSWITAEVAWNNGPQETVGQNGIPTPVPNPESTAQTDALAAELDSLAGAIGADAGC